MLKATSDQLHDEDLDAALASTWSPSRISSRPAKRARVELETVEQVGRKTVSGNACINNVNVNADSAVREADDSSDNGSDESDYSDDEFECQVQGTYNRLEVDQYCENKDELQHDDEQEEELNRGHTNTQTKNRTREKGPYKRRDGPIPWEDRIRDLKVFKETFGHCRVKKSFKDNPGLGRFVATIRSYKNRIKRGAYSGSVLTPARIKALEELGFEWHREQKKRSNTNEPTRSFDQRIDQLKAFKELHGHLRVTKSLDQKLASFCVRMREARRKPTPRGRIITEERIKALDELGFQWNDLHQLTTGQVRSFEQRIDQLKAFKELHGHLRVTGTLDLKLASFCGRMREARRKPTSAGTIITEERIKALDELGFEWTIMQKHLAKGQARAFEQHVDQLKAFKEAHGHLRLTNAVDQKLASFCCSMRQARRKPTSTGGIITAERIKALDDLGFEWNEQHQLSIVQTLSAEKIEKCGDTII